ncbi:cell envelope integrity EipB family protein [Flexibacterium corallicola]|uniref:cell envelope integrity EipB family protein n=1 Tax=Flexibacterium corallicola TaxID=3037259 RepID=UPI00286ECF63|nr:cell envelope integrity EipB family protein [Pseudovibrio sp. M1P-2-3]
MPNLVHLSHSLIFIAGTCIAVPSAPAAESVELTSHRAVYDMQLIGADDSSGILDVNGRMVYELTGNTCRGHSVSVRFMLQIEGDGGEAQLTDLQSTTFEGANGEVFRFANRTYINDELAEEIEGAAAERQGAINVNLEQPRQETLQIDGETLFPTEHLSQIIHAARRGESFLLASVFDGSESGDTVFDTTALIGKSFDIIPRDYGSSEQAISGIGSTTAWPVTVSYFKQENANHESEQTPDYQLEFVLHENGASHDLVLNYGAFEIFGRLVHFEHLPEVPCS